MAYRFIAKSYAPTYLRFESLLKDSDMSDAVLSFAGTYDPYAALDVMRGIVKSGPVVILWTVIHCYLSITPYCQKA